MLRYIVRRLLQIVPVLLIITFMVFALMLAIPGDPARALIGPGESLDAEQLEIIRKEYNLDKPVLVQYGLWLGKVLRGDLGRSTQYQRPVAQELGTRAWVTLQFGIAAWVFAVLIALPAGILSAVYRAAARRTTSPPWCRSAALPSRASGSALCRFCCSA